MSARKLFYHKETRGDVILEMVIWQLPERLRPAGGLGVVTMKRIEIEIMRSSDALNAAIDTWHIAESGKDVTQRLSFGSIKDLFSAITEKRLELLRYVAEQKEVLNIRQLTQALGRNYKNVHTDVSALEKLGLIAKDEKGALTVPYDEIVIHAGLTEAA